METARNTHDFYKNKNGSATSNPSGGTTPYKYAWAPVGGTAQTSTTLSSGTDKCTITDAHGCTATATVSLTQPTAIGATFTKTPPQCFGDSKGIIIAKGNGGSGSYTGYSWAPYGGSSSTAAGLSSQYYTVTVTDNTGCSGTASISLGQPVIITASVTGPSCLGQGGKGKVVAVGAGGTAPYNYTWSNGSSTVGTTGTINLPNGSYTVTVSDKYSCPSATASISFGACPSALGPDEAGNGTNSGLTDITVYPNPSSGQFTIEGLDKGMIVEMYDYTGRIISTQTSTLNTLLSINLSNQPNGIYLIRILDKDGNLVGQKKVVKTN